MNENEIIEIMNKYQSRVESWLDYEIGIDTMDFHKIAKEITNHLSESGSVGVRCEEGDANSEVL